MTHSSFNSKNRNNWPLIIAFGLVAVIAADLAQAHFHGYPPGTVGESISIVPYFNSIGDALLAAQ
jgi:hypothetical protein